MTPKYQHEQFGDLIATDIRARFETECIRRINRY